MTDENDESLFKKGSNVEKEQESNQLKYAQQHLANERTYLAWIRTAVAIIGIGFLATSLHFSIGNADEKAAGNVLIIILGLSAGIFGILVIVGATVSYLRKEKQMIKQTFSPTHKNIHFFSLFLIVITFIALLYVSRLL